MSVRLGFIGAGGIANAHLNALAGMPEAEVVSICDVERSRAEKAAARFDATVHINYRTMIESEKLDAVFICVPPFAHGEAELLAVEAGLHLFVEKPIALSVEKANQVAQAAEKAGIIAAVGYHWRYMTATDRAKEIMGDKPIAMVRGRWIGGMPGVAWWRVKEKSGGQIVEQTTHLFDLARYFAGDVRSVAAVGYQGILAPRTPNYNVEDASAVILKFQNNTIGTIASGDIAGVGCGPELSLISDGLIVEIRSSGLEVLKKGERAQIANQGSPTEREDAAFLQAIQSGDASEVRSTYADAAKTLAVTLAANESMETGKVVFVQ